MDLKLTLPDEAARVLIVDRWIALYRLVDEGVQIVTIVDGSRDLTRLDWASHLSDE